MNTSKPAWRKTGILLVSIGILGFLIFAVSPSYVWALTAWSGIIGGVFALLFSLFGKSESKTPRRMR